MAGKTDKKVNTIKWERIFSTFIYLILSLVIFAQSVNKYY